MSASIGYKIDKIVFSIFSPHDIRKMSVIEVTNPDTYDEDGVPVPGGIMDPRFGSQEPYQVCPICGNTGASCPGHFGHIELAEPVLHTLFLKEIFMTLKSVCRVCGRVKLPPDKREKALKLLERVTKYRRDLIDRVIRKIAAVAAKQKVCPYCKAESLQIEFQKPYIFSVIDKEGRARRLYPNEIREIFERIPDEDLPLLGFNPEKSRPEWLILEVLPVPPLTIRPSTQLEVGMRSEDDLTHKLVDIVKVNQKVKESKEAGSPAIIVRDTIDLLQYHVATFFDNTIPGIPPARHRSGRQLRTLAQRLSGKEGRFRTNLVGKRVNFSARTVISPDSNLAIHEVGVPIEIAKKLTIPERVTSLNIDRLRKAVINGPDKYPGANYIIRPDGRRIYLKYAPNREALAEALEPGYIVERHLIDGDIVLFNRQPSLHRPSIMAHTVRVLPYRTFRLHLAVCPPYNADFDGDEMNLHVLQNEEAIAEAKTLMRVQKQIISPRYGAPIIGMGKDHITAAYLLTHKDTLLTKQEFFDLLAAMEYDGPIPEPIIKEPIPLYSGKQLFSLLLPEDFTYSLKAASCRNCDKCLKERCPYDAYVIVKRGKLTAGVIDKNSIGAEKADSILHRLAREYGSEYAAVFLTKLSRVLDRFLSSIGFSMGPEHLTLPVEAYEEIDEILKRARERVDELIEMYKRGRLKEIKGYTVEESLELMIMDVLSKARDESGKVALRYLKEENPLFIMTATGARGSPLNVAQLSAVLGQQSVRGERVKRGFNQRCLTTFRPGDYGASARGFVFNSFLKGLTPTEFFFHAMAGREGLVDTAVRTQQSGYLQRRLVNSLSHLYVAYDYTVRTLDGRIIQFEYGDDKVDPARSDHGKPVNVKRLVDSVSLLYPRGKTSTKEFIDKILEKVRNEIPESLVDELREELLNRKLPEEAVKEAVREAVIYYKTSLIDPGAAIGVVTAQSIGEPGTQMTLRTFHFAGVRERDVTLGLPRIIEVVDARRKPSTPVMKIYLKEEYAKDQAKAERIANKIVETYLKDIVTESYIDLVNSEIVFVLNMDKVKARGITEDKLIKLSRKYEVKVEENLIKVKCPKKKTFAELQKIRGKMLEKQIGGIKDITHVTVQYENGEWILYTKGSNLAKVLKLPEVDPTRTTTNDIRQIAEVLGIEAARNAIINEIKGVLDEQGLDVDIRHIMLVADLMTHTGKILQTGRYGVIAGEESVLARAAFEITVQVLKRAAARGEEDRLMGVTENLIVGGRIPVGTGQIEVYMEAPKVHANKK
ncbi:DNA-directed RNA polymerase subunit A'/A'' [Candidatus Geothermarchaeota archaeon]|nr:MAG: DNA-directed RNA polymerase subunit A'/A'' [Candidatus Geothermarchaeota archaeon]